MYLLDTSAASHTVDAQSPHHAALQALLFGGGLFGNQLYISTITVGEIKLGELMLSDRLPAPTAARVQEVAQRVKRIGQLTQTLDVTSHVAEEYSRIKHAYAKRWAPNLLRNQKLKGKPVELWHEGLSATGLQVQENDLWIAATASVHDLELLSVDGHHDRVRDAYPQLRLLLVK